MEDDKVLNYIKDILENMPPGWLGLTTHRLDIYDEKLAKTQFLDQFESLFKNTNSEAAALGELPTAYDYIRLGHPLSCVLEWVIANLRTKALGSCLRKSCQRVSTLTWSSVFMVTRSS